MVPSVFEFGRNAGRSPGPSSTIVRCLFCKVRAAGPTGVESVGTAWKHAGQFSRSRFPVQRQAGSPGETILDEARGLGCDLLIKGAYTQSRLRQVIFGGATRHILEHAEVPVFMAYS